MFIIFTQIDSSVLHILNTLFPFMIQASAGMIRDDDLYDLLVKGCPDGVHMVSLMDCCHSGTY
jgi:hypothetical protein